ncbi:hypothetical protein ABE527_05035 [Brucella sp. TWI432]
MSALDNLTIGEAKQLAAMFGGAAVQDSPANPLIGEKVIIRASAAGVHYGTLVSVDGTTVILKNARRLWYWEVANKAGISLSDVAEHGVSKNAKICATVPTHTILNAAEIMTTTEAAQASIEGANDYRP